MEKDKYFKLYIVDEVIAEKIITKYSNIKDLSAFIQKIGYNNSEFSITEINKNEYNKCVYCKLEKDDIEKLFKKEIHKKEKTIFYYKRF